MLSLLDIFMLYPCFLMLIGIRLYIFLEVNWHKTIARRLIMEYNTRRIYSIWTEPFG